MDQYFIQIERGVLHYRKWGYGNRVLIALHGYGADGNIFETLAKQLKDSFTLYAIDLPFHGLTRWESERYDAEDIAQAFNLILKKENVNNCSLLGHSFGAKIAMKLLEYEGERVSVLYLLSPDGIGTRWLNWSRLTPRSMRRIVITNADLLLRFSKWFRDRNLIPFFVEWFLRKNLTTEKDKSRLLHTWLSFESFIIKKRRLQKLIQLHFVKVIVIIGQRDKLLKTGRIEQFAKELPNAEFYDIASNHSLDFDKVAAILLKNITTSPERL
ncbi:MAG: alpha/beta hydrolase [Saprospiraceae bacterium]|nr:alpha/beta hydrolase [Saprospiraceae bacterium]